MLSRFEDVLFVLVLELIEEAGGDASEDGRVDEVKVEEVRVELKKLGKNWGEGKGVLDVSEVAELGEVVGGSFPMVMVTVRSIVVVCVSVDAREDVAKVSPTVTVVVIIP